MRVTGLVPEQEAAEQEVDSSGGHRRDACYVKDGKEEGRWGAEGTC